MEPVSVFDSRISVCRLQGVARTAVFAVRGSSLAVGGPTDAGAATNRTARERPLPALRMRIPAHPVPVLDKQS